MKVIAINGSPNKDGNTYQALAHMAEILAAYNIETEIVHIGNAPVQGCIGCNSCFKPEAKGCIFTKDSVNETAAKMLAAEGFILGSPTYCGGITGSVKAYLDRVFYSSFAKSFAGKVAGLAVVARRSGGVDAVHQLTNYVMLTQAVLAPASYWLLAHGLRKGEVMQDGEGLQILRGHARNMAWLMQCLNASKNTIPLPKREDRIMTNFIR